MTEFLNLLHLTKIPYDLDTNIQELHLLQNDITIETYAHVRVLLLYSNNITNYFTSLIGLDLGRNKITKIDNLYSSINMNLTFNNIQRIQNLDKLINLRVLFLVNIGVHKIENLDTLVNLERLCLNKNKITKIENLDTLINLKKLELNVNQITKMANLNKLSNLQELQLSNNKITKIQQLNNLNKLMCLNIDNNPIEGPITTLETYKEHIKKVKTVYELEWCDYYIILAIINSQCIDIYRMYMKR